MNQMRAEDSEAHQRSAFFNVDDESSSEPIYHGIAAEATGNSSQEHLSGAENEGEDNSENRHRSSGSSCSTENSIISPRMSLVASQTLNERDPNDESLIRSPEEIFMCERGSLAEVAKNVEQFQVYDSRCNSPLLNGHANSEGENKTTVLLEPCCPSSKNSNRSRKRAFSLFNRKQRAESDSTNLNNDVVITVNEGLTSPETKPTGSVAFAVHLRSWLEPMENKVNVKLFGSRKAMTEEVIRYRGAGWIIHPRSAFRLYWDLIILALLIINMFVLPVAIAFFNDDMSPSWIAFNSVSDGVFLLDIVLNFRTGVLVNRSPEKYILDPKRIAFRYLTTWFSVDLVSSFPFDYVAAAATSSRSGGLLGASRALRILRMAKILSLLRLLRISRLVRYIHQYEEVLNVTRSVIRFINLISLMMLVAHWNGCMQYFVPVLNDFPDNSWVIIHNLKSKPWTEQYLWALFKALSHMLCIGYGRHPPQNLPETCVTIFSMMTGATFYALFIAYSINVISQIDSPGRQYREKIQQIEDYMSYRKLPVPLRDKISKYYEHRFQGKLFDEGKILGEVSRPLKEAIVNFNCRDLVRAVPFFYDADPDFVSAIITKLSFEVYLEGDVIIREGELGTEMYFLKSGVVSVTCGGIAADDLTDGSYFGEICLLTNARRTATIQAKTVCDIFILFAEDFREVVDEYPTMRQVMESVATQRLSRMGKSVDFSACLSKECLLARPVGSTSSSICYSCSNLLKAKGSHPEIVITREVASMAQLSDTEVNEA